MDVEKHLARPARFAAVDCAAGNQVQQFGLGGQASGWLGHHRRGVVGFGLSDRECLPAKMLSSNNLASGTTGRPAQKTIKNRQTGRNIVLADKPASRLVFTA